MSNKKKQNKEHVLKHTTGARINAARSLASCLTWNENCQRFKATLF